MNWKPKDDSLFAILLRSPWWISVAIGGALGVIAVAFLPAEYRAVGAIAGLPFFGIGGIAAWRQWQAPSAARIQNTLAAVHAMSWPEFSRAIEDAYQRQGYRVSTVAKGAASFEISKDGRTALVHCKRWKVARTGVEPLSELHASKDARNAHECIYVAAGEISANARTFAAKHAIRLVEAPELAKLLPSAGRSKKSSGDRR